MRAARGYLFSRPVQGQHARLDSGTPDMVTSATLCAQHLLTVTRARAIHDAPQRSSTARGAICARVSRSWQGRSLRLPALLAGIGVGLAACATPFPSAPSPGTRSPKSESTQCASNDVRDSMLAVHIQCVFFCLMHCRLKPVCFFIVLYQILTRPLTGAAHMSQATGIARDAKSEQSVATPVCNTPHT